ncbi:hypothetical protein M422DRAFT_243161 [Sphaerobolus stellatus SS14]|nr:hypothetical protein M422DRAFT_243161 [Sphaerobolus stellatus SS14]
MDGVDDNSNETPAAQASETAIENNEECVPLQQTEISVAEQQQKRPEVDSLKMEAVVEHPKLSGNEDSAEDDTNDEDVDDEDVYVPLEAPIPLPMPTFTDFSVPLLEVEETPEEPKEEPKPLATLPDVIHITSLLKPLETPDPSPSLHGIQIVHVGRECGLVGNLQASYHRLPPGTRLTRPLALRYGDSITYCISGQGLLWQNGWTFPFVATDAVGWKAGTGITHTIINDSNADGSAGEDLFLITAYEVKDNEEVYYPLVPDISESSPILEGRPLWKTPPTQGDLGPHPGVPSVSPERGNAAIPAAQIGYRPSNIINAINELDSIGKGVLFANATSLSQETGLSGRFGCNFEVPPPGTRSSDPHAHSLEDELVYVVEGSGLVWINGHVQPIRTGDAVGFSAGTGIAHAFINDSNADGEEGEPLILWIIGQNRRLEGDMVYYPLHPANARRIWSDPPKYELGPHKGEPSQPFRNVYATDHPTPRKAGWKSAAK